MFKSAEEREAERREKEAAHAQAALARQEAERAAAEAQAAAEFAASPAGQATAAKRAEERFFEIQLEIGSSAATLAQIERVGWRLVHAGYFFMPTGERSSAQIFGTGQNTEISGTTVGAYLFRNSDDQRDA